jgi:xylulokinase
MSELASQPVILGIDLGTSAVKVIALQADDQVLAEGGAAFPTASTLPQQAEQSPADWLHALSNAMQSLAARLRETCGPGWQGRIAAIGLTGQLPTLVCLAEHDPLGPAITWKDGRADAWASARIDAPRRAALYARTGMPIDGRYLAPMLGFHFGDRLAGVRCILSAKDYLAYALTGLRATEPSTAAGYGVYDLHDRRFSASLCEPWHLPPALLPQLRPANSLAGPLGAAGAALLGLPEGIPVSIGAADSVCAAYAMAGLDQAIVSISFGSSAVVIGACAALNLDPAARYLLTPHAVDGWYGREMDLLASGTGYHWLGELFGWRGGELDVHAAASVPGANGLCFPPYLAGGEQGALWNPRLRAGIFGLTLRHSRDDIARAYLEGVCFEIRRCIDVLAETSSIDLVRVCGNIVDSPASLQMLADILGRPVGSVPHKSPAAVGAALLARSQATGAVPRAAHRTGAVPTVHPDPSAVRAYQTLYQDYLLRAARCE